MNAQLTITESSLAAMEAEIISRVEAAKAPVQEAMGEMFLAVTRSNVGDFGLDRPAEWAPLSPSYARKVKRAHATLYVSGRLEEAIKIELSPDAAKVSTSDDSVPYAIVHQFGGGNNIPARPYFPVLDNEVTPFTQQLVKEAAQAALEGVL
jgi:phage gpG-like protein